MSSLHRHTMTRSSEAHCKMRDHSLCVACVAEGRVQPRQAYYCETRKVQFACCLEHQLQLKVGIHKQYIPQNGQDYSTW